VTKAPHKATRPKGATSSDIKAITSRLREFADERDWGKFHTPKNLVMALTGEVGELSELFQWLGPKDVGKLIQDPVFMGKVRDEIADVAAYIFRLSDVLDIDLGQAMQKKIDKNAQKYPVEKAKGHARKYSEL
jgi:dCTP diphosphatase